MQIEVIVKSKSFFGKKKVIALNVGNERLKNFIRKKALDFIDKEVVEPYIRRHLPKAKNYMLVEDNIWESIKEL